MGKRSPRSLSVRINTLVSRAERWQGSAGTSTTGQDQQPTRREQDHRRRLGNDMDNTVDRCDFARSRVLEDHVRIVPLERITGRHFAIDIDRRAEIYARNHVSTGAGWIWAPACVKEWIYAPVTGCE